MDLFRRIVFIAAIAGFITGGVVTVIHHFTTAEVIARAEVFETVVGVAAPDRSIAVPHMHATATTAHEHEQGAEEWEPQEGFERTAYTALADVVTGIAFGLLLVAAYEFSGRSTGWRAGLFWGFAGFVTFTLAPCLGLPPEVPGTEAAPLMARQVWWIATAACTAAGLALLFLQRQPVWTAAGLGLLFLPHLYGAPVPAEYGRAVPEALAHEFIVLSMLTNLLFWSILGILTGLLHKRMAHPVADRGKVPELAGV